MKDKTCACCQGIHKSTPAQIANRPGLFALNYRVGTHATFLETMKARLSNFYLEDTEPRGLPLTDKAYPLMELATRDADDPAIALLDAWATVADVLTFYQERIANEGYLQTATERRSVLELARLVGYNLRPGVASSTYLAYILDKESVVTIPAGSRAQSVPGPGETMQSFETTLDLPARAEWNTLRPRTSRPQFPDAPERVAGKALYFKGITTNLKPNDAILVDFGDVTRGQQLYRVVEVVPDAAVDRTQVTLQTWAQDTAALLEGTQPQAESFSSARLNSPAFADAMTLRADVERVEEIVLRYGNKEEFGDLLKTRTGGKVLESLETLVSGSPVASDLELASLLDEEVLPALRDELRVAQEGHFTRLEPWIQQIITELEGAIESTHITSSMAANDEALFSAHSFSASTSGAGNQDASATSGTTDPFQLNLEKLLESLETPPSIPPANPSQLERKVATAFSPASDIKPNLLTALRPGLAPLLLKAIENRPVKQTTARVYAMRTRASVFGHNAPLQPVTDDKGKVTGQREWTLTRFGEAGTEDFFLEVRFLVQRKGLPGGSPPEGDDVGSPPSNATAPALRYLFHTRIKIGNFAEVSHPITLPGEILQPHEFDINYSAAGENPIKVNVEVPGGTTGTSLPGFLPRCILTFKFKQRPITVKVDFSQQDFVRQADHLVTTAGLNPLESEVVISPGGFPQGNEPVDFGLTLTLKGKALTAQIETTEKANIVSLDAPYPQIMPSVKDGIQSWVAIERAQPNQTPLVIISPILQVKEASRADYGLALKGTQLTLPLLKPWLNPVFDAKGLPTAEIDLGQNTFAFIRGTTVFAQSEELELAEAPLDPLVNALCGGEIELDGFYSGLEAGHWLIITGERADVKLKASPPKKDVPAESSPPEDDHPAHGHESMMEASAEAEEKPSVIGGLKSAELVMLSGIRHNNPSGDKFSTTLLLANSLAYCYKLDTVIIYGNVAHATHGETRSEVLGSGDASKPLQTFTLKQPPLTFVSAPTVSGTESTLRVRVNDILWHETESMAELGPKDRRYLTRTNDEGKTEVIFGNGEKGARPATGIENITAAYRNGIGRAGNVQAGQITLLATKPLGVKEVVNPLAATGGADKEDRDTARRNAPMAVMSLDRLVSVRDYEDFARTFAGIGKVSATKVSDGRRQIVFLTIAGADDIPIADTSDLLQNLRRALQLYGDPFQAVQIRKRRLKLLVASASIRVHPDYLWEKVEPRVRASMLDKFSFAQRELGQDILLSEIISAMQMVEGVVYVDVDLFGAVDEDIAAADLTKYVAGFAKNVERVRVPVRMAEIDEKETDPLKRIRAAELGILTPAVPDTLILKEVKA